MSGPIGDEAHIRTPPAERGALWWLEEHAVAEQAVTIAGRALDGTDEPTRRCMWGKLLDRRLDHLEEVEGRCDEILDALRESAPEWVAESCELHYLRGMSWAAIGRKAFKDPSGIIRELRTWVRACDR